MEKIIEIVRQYPIIYDLSHEDYRNFRKKDKIWNKIGKEIGENGEDVKKKWRNLRDTYAKYIKCNKNKTAQSSNKYKKWIWADQMEGFRPFLNSSQTTSNVSDIPSEESIKIEPEETLEISEICLTEQTSTFTPTSNSTSEVASAHHETSKENRKRKTEPSTSVQDVIKYFESKKKKEFDAIDQLFLAHACTIKTFSARRQIEVKMKIAQVIMEHELLHLEENTSNSYHTGE